jgi:DNA recombination protein RmuC
MIALSTILAVALAVAVVYAASTRTRERQLAKELLLNREWLDSARAESRAQLERHLRELAALRDKQAVEVARLNDKFTAVESARSSVEAQLNAFGDRQQLLAAEQKKLEDTIALASRQALDSNSKQFLQLAEQMVARTQESSKAELDKRTQAVEQLVKPVQESLTRVDEKIGKLEKSGEVAAAALTEQMRTVASNNERLRDETARLSTALRAPATRGRWGETQLKRTLELAGLRLHVDFHEQPVATLPDGVLRPDVAVRLPGDKTVLLDSKVPMEAWLRALDAPDDASDGGRAALMRMHASQLRAHVESLSRKQYWEAFAGSPEMAVLFLPSDGLLAAALEVDPTLHEDAFARRIVLATPATLLALLLTVAHVWKQESLAENARAIAAEGRMLHKRLATLSEHLHRHGRALESALKSYNAVVGSFDSRVVPAARRLEQLDAAGEGAQLVPQLELDVQPHTPKALLEASVIEDAN